MSPATRLNGYLLTLLLTALVLPTVSPAMDLYFANDSVQITGGADYVLKTDVPEDKTYTGGLMCLLEARYESVPASTTLTTTLLRDGQVVTVDTHTYQASDWLQDESNPNLYYIPLYANGIPELHYHFDMPAPGPAQSQLRTGTYEFSFEISSQDTESNNANNLVYSDSFDYTVYSGALLYNGGQQTITSLTPSTFLMCTGSEYFSAMGGSWTAAWWDDHFATPGLCADSAPNSDGFSTDVVVRQNLSLAQGPNLSGQNWTVKGQMPPDLTLSGMQIECSGTPPSRVTLATALEQEGVTITTYSEQLMPTWQNDVLRHVYTYTVPDSSYSLPESGPDNSSQLQTGAHSFVSTVSCELDTSAGNDTAETSFQYTVYSGHLYFNQVVTDFTTIDFDTSTLCYDGSMYRWPIGSIDLSWTDIFPPQPMSNSTTLCAAPTGNPDGYSIDLVLHGGEADFNDIDTSVAGMSVVLSGPTLDSSGGSFSSATVTLPHDVTAHDTDPGTGFILPRGHKTLVFSGANFVRTLEDVTLTASPTPKLHGYGLPFYVSSGSFSFDLDGSSGLVANGALPVYVHTESLQSLAADDLRKSFPSNDIIFIRNGGTNSVTLNQDGFSGSLEFKGDNSLEQETSFPRATITFGDWDLTLTSGAIDTASSINEMQLFMRFGQGCHESDCSGSGSTWYRVAVEQAFLTSNGAFGAGFGDLGPNLDGYFQETGDESVEWGDLSADGPPTFVRHDRSRRGAFLVPGFIMTGTSDKLPAPYRLAQVLLGSYGFSKGAPSTFRPLHDQDKPEATLGDGIFPGFNLGPETYTTLDEGIGEILDLNTLVHFYEPPSSPASQPPVKMWDRPAVKYVLRPGGLTGVFNTEFNVDNGGLVNIYGYDLAFDRFAFRQDRNRLDNETFIDGKLTLHEGPVARDVDNNQQDFEVSFVNLDLTCNGNLGSGSVDAQPEPDWPLCSGQGEHKACQNLAYWNMPVLLTAMSFENDPDTDPATGVCPSSDRLLTIQTRNQVDGLGRPLSMSGMYTPKGTVEHQKLSGEVETWFDRPRTGSKPGFDIRLQTAYLNEVPSSLESWPGFTVLAGLTDVPLFNDAHLAGHFDNADVNDSSTYKLYMFQDQTDDDGNGSNPRDGVPDSYNLNVTHYRDLLVPDNAAAPSPYFEYSWPTDSMINLNYYAQYNEASGEDMPWFKGITKTSDVVKVIQVKSVPDYINPEKTKFSFGVSADLANLQNFQIDLSDFTGSVDTFLHDVLQVPGSFSLDDVLCSSVGGSKICLYSLEQDMLSQTGGDLSVVMGKAVDTLLNKQPLAGVIKASAHTLNLAHQAPAQVSGILLEPLRATRDELVDRVTSRLAGSFTSLYSNDYQAAIAVYDPQSLLDITSGRPQEEEIAAMTAKVEQFRSEINQLIDRLDQGITGYETAFTTLTRVGDGVIPTLLTAGTAAQEALGQLADTIDQELNSLTSPDPGTNPMLQQVNNAREKISDVRNAIAAVDLTTLGNVLQAAAALSGASIDTSLLDAARQSITTALRELDDTIAQADSALQAAYGSLPLAGLLTPIRDLLQNNLLNNLKTVAAALEQLQSRIEMLAPAVSTGLADLKSQLESLRQIVASNQSIDPSITTWDQAESAARTALDQMAQVAFNSPNNSFPQLFENSFAALIHEPFKPLLEDTAPGGIQDLMDSMVAAVTSGLPQPSEQDIRNMIRISLVNSPAVAQVNQVFFTQFGLLSDQMDTISTGMTDRMNELIRQTIDAVNQSMSSQLAGSTIPVGGSNWGLSSVGIDGYALVSQDEFERIHLGAEFVFGNDSDPTSYNAALDVTSWKADNGKTGCVDAPGDYFDVTISTHDVTADMLGMDVGIKTAMIGFTINNAGPIGVFGNCYLAGEINFEVLVLEDLGLEVGVGAEETYFGATGAGRFQEYRIPKAAFFVGRSCNFDVLSRLDPEIAGFIGPFSPLEGIYARGSVSVPIYNGGCWFTLGAGVDVGAWYFTQPPPRTFGGLFGGSAYGSLGCLASIKGMIRCIGQKSGGVYKFNGSGWVGAGVGFCSPGSWQNVGDVRSDSWCLTGDASFGATYLMDDGVSGDLSITGPNVNCCD